MRAKEKLPLGTAIPSGSVQNIVTFIVTQRGENGNENRVHR